MSSSGPRLAMILAAERLMAEQGISAVTLQAVMDAAGQRNKSAAQYHFGSRAGLVTQILELRMKPINERRLQMLTDFDTGLSDSALRTLVEILVIPLADVALSTPGSYYARFLAHNYADPLLLDLTARSSHAESYRMWIDRIPPQLEEIPAPLRDRRVEHVRNTAMVAVADIEGYHVDQRIRDAWVSDLIEVLLAGLMAPVPSSVRATISQRYQEPA